MSLRNFFSEAFYYYEFADLLKAEGKSLMIWTLDRLGLPPHVVYFNHTLTLTWYRGRTHIKIVIWPSTSTDEGWGATFESHGIRFISGTRGDSGSRHKFKQQVIDRQDYLSELKHNNATLHEYQSFEAVVRHREP